MQRSLTASNQNKSEQLACRLFCNHILDAIRFAVSASREKYYLPISKKMRSEMTF